MTPNCVGPQGPPAQSPRGPRLGLRSHTRKEREQKKKSAKRAPRKKHGLRKKSTARAAGATRARQKMNPRPYIRKQSLGMGVRGSYECNDAAGFIALKKSAARDRRSRAWGGSGGGFEPTTPGPQSLLPTPRPNCLEAVERHYTTPKPKGPHIIRQQRPASTGQKNLVAPREPLDFF